MLEEDVELVQRVNDFLWHLYQKANITYQDALTLTAAAFHGSANRTPAPAPDQKDDDNSA